MLGITVQQLSEGDKGIYETAEKMVEMIRTESTTYYVRQWAEVIIQDVPERDKWGEVKALYNFVKEHIRYTRDMIEMEYIQGPTYLLSKIGSGETALGDCDDSTVLLLSLLRTIGFMVRVKLTGYAPSEEFTHVYGEVLIDEHGWVPVDTIVERFTVGDEAPNPIRVKLYEV